MKKLFSIFFISLALLLLFSGIAKAAAICDESNGGQNGLVPCGNAVDGSNNLICRCELAHVFILIKNIYDFIIFKIATPLAGLLIVLGGILIIISGGPGGRNPVTGVISPNMYSMAKNIIIGAVIGIVLIFGAYLIISIILQAIGYAPGINF